MKKLSEYINEALNASAVVIENKEETIKSVDDFKEYAKKKFKEVFGEDNDEEEMNKIIDGILKDCKKEVDDKDFGKAIGLLNKSFAN